MCCKRFSHVHTTQHVGSWKWNPTFINKNKLYTIYIYYYINLYYITIYYLELLCFEWCPPWHSIQSISYSFWHSILIKIIFGHFFWRSIWRLLRHCISSAILSGKSSDILCGIPSGILSDISAVILSGISSGILSGGWGPALPTAIRLLPTAMKSGEEDEAEEDGDYKI